MRRTGRGWGVAGAIVMLVLSGAGAAASGQGRAGGPPQTAAPGDSSRPPGRGTIIGRVVEADGVTPIAGAIVQLSGGGLGIGGSAFAAATGPGSRAVQVNSVGQFLFTALPKGSYSLRVNATGYLAGQYGQDHPQSPIPRALDITRQIDLADAETKTDVTVRLWRLGVITGTVVDEYGQPVVGVDVNVTAVQEIWIGRISSNVDRATTDDRGMYRAEVAPGDYIVGVGASITTVPARMAEDYAQSVSDASSFRAAMDQINASGLPGPPPTSGMRLGDLIVGTSYQQRASPWVWTNGDNGPLFVYPSTYYPSASLSTMASVVNVPAGVERSAVDIQLRPEAAFRVSGRLVGPGGPMPGIGVRLIGADFNTKTNSPPLFTTTAATDANGAFTFVGVTPGQYTVEAVKSPVGSRPGQAISVTTANGGSSFSVSGPMTPPVQDPLLWASQPVVVGNADVSNITLSMTEGARLSGRFEFASAATPLTPEQIRSINVSVRVLPGTIAGRLFPNPLLGTSSEDGVTFRTSELVPGTYIVTASRLPAGWSLASAMTGGKDAADAPVEISASGVSDLVLTFTNKLTTLSGSVTGDDNVAAPGLPPPSPTVVVFSTNQSLWPKVALSPRTLRSNPVGSGLRFQVTGMPPGEYYVAASSSSADFTDPKVLLFLSKTASRVTLVEGEARSQDVHAVVVPAIK